ncbi:cell cycle checkpoint protein rad17 [Zymoseptoria brevis]|uniref:Cell cycle checkpoint protein rad17 n=1 Tax=Zymoseptoria brevis TaxID=1047168 RepID=A0A0F4G6S3_9PEZI|nr:cell cycle checkpoint protein rad17 [Zymoseptoria brevis]
MAPRASRRKVVTISSDEDDEHQASEPEKESPKPQKRSTGKLKSVKKGATESKAKKPSLQKSPKKSTANAKASSKDAPKPAGKPIYSFFNNATQKQQVAQPKPAPKMPLVAADDAELIQDDTDDEYSNGIGSTTVLAKDSTTALAMRKRKLQRAQSFGNEPQPSLAGSQKFRKAAGGERVPSFGVLNNDKRPWTEQFAPIDLTELAVHKRKVSDVRTWLEMACSGRRQRVLILKGAAGTGKTTTIQLLAKDLDVELIHWRDPGSSEHKEDGFVSSGSRFEDFVARAGKSSSLMFSSDADAIPPADLKPASTTAPSLDRPRALLIEEFPNTFSRTSTPLNAFRSTIAQYVSMLVPSNTNPTPMIMIISETLLSTNTAAADSFTAHRLLGPELITNPYINVIEFNPVAPTYLVKALETVVVKEARKSGRRRTPGPHVLKRLAETGDLRSAVSSLEFLCLRGDDGDTWSSKVSFTKPKQSKTHQPLTKAEEDALRLITNRESSIGIFHSVGKVVYNKRKPAPPGTTLAQPPDWLPMCRRDEIPETDVDSFMDEIGTDVSTLVAALHENYAISCSAPNNVEKTLSSLSGCIENLSDSDLLSLDRFSFGTRAFSGSATDTLRQDEMCFQVAVRGLLFSLPNPVHRSLAVGGKKADAHRMLYPNSLRLWRRQEEVESSIESLVATVARGGSVDAQAAGASTGVVESWQRNKTTNTGHASDEADASIRPDTSSQAKKEMILERLPYLARVVDARPPSLSNRRLLDQVLSITRISGPSMFQEDDDGEPDERTEQAASGEQWTTDRPDEESSTTKTTTTKHQSTFDNITIPVRGRVEQLVLEDDDIVDD